MNMKRGTELHPEDRAHVLRAYVHRYTGEHCPTWAQGLYKGKPYPIQFTNDSDWLANTEFGVRKDGRLDGRMHRCLSHPTWPNNHELR